MAALVEEGSETHAGRRVAYETRDRADRAPGFGTSIGLNGTGDLQSVWSLPAGQIPVPLLFSNALVIMRENRLLAVFPAASPPMMPRGPSRDFLRDFPVPRGPRDVPRGSPPGAWRYERDRLPPGMPSSETAILRLRGLPFSATREDVAAWFNSSGALNRPIDGARFATFRCSHPSRRARVGKSAFSSAGEQ